MRREELPGLIAALIVLVFRLSLIYVRLQVKSKRAGRKFRRHLIHGGMRRELADRLVEDYRGAASLRKLVSQLGGNGIPFLR